MTTKLLAIIALCVGPLSAVVTVSTAQYNNVRSGENTSETVITTANVSSLVKLGQYALDAPVYGQPLYVPALSINGSTYNVVVVGTMNNTVYALDADNPGAAPLWSTNFGATWTTYSPPALFPLFYGAPIGILSTPVIDASAKLVYVVTVNNTPTYTLRKINLLTGVQSSSVDISGSVSGSGAGSSGGTMAFNAAIETQRVALTLANSAVYVGFGSINETGTWHGWLFSYNASTLARNAVLCTTPNGNGGGVWGSAGGLVVDGSGNLYFTTGNGDWDGSANFSQSVVKVNSSLAIQDWFTPSNESATSALDADVASGRLMLIPSTTLLTFASKDGSAWVIDSTNMGHLQGAGGAAPQVFTVASITVTDHSGTYGGCYFNGNGYFPIVGMPMYGFAFSGSTFTTTAFANTSGSFSQMMLAGSSNSGSNAILWALTVSSSAAVSAQPVILRALNPATLTEYWNSGSTIGSYAKFASPTVANGRVYVPTNGGSLVAFGLPSAVKATSVTGFLKVGP